MARPTTPHLAMPLQVRAGEFVATEQGSPRHCQDQAEVVVRTRPGALEADPGFGLRELVARIGPAAPEVDAALREFVPDVEFLVAEEAETVAARVRNVSIDLEEPAT